MNVTTPDMFLERAAPALAAAAGSVFAVPGEVVLGRNRTADVALARQAAMVAARRADFSLPQVARAFGRNHTTVLYAERVVATREREDPAIAELVARLADSLTAGRDVLRQAGREVDLTELELRVAVAEQRAVAATQRAADAEALVVAERDRGAAALRDLSNAQRMLADQAAHVEALQRALRSAKSKASRVPNREYNRVYQQGYRRGRATERVRLAERRRSAGLALTKEIVGDYTTATGHRRTVLLTVHDGQRVLVDRGPDDERIVEQFGGPAQLLAVAAIAGGYLEEARRLGRPVVSQTT